MSWDWLHALDIWGLHFLNVDLRHPMLDQFWLIITHLDRQSWAMFILLPLVLGWLLSIYKWSLFRMLGVLILAVGLTDTLCYRVIKGAVDRQRPFDNSEVKEWVRQVGDAHGPSFPSNHAANCFAGAAILAWYFVDGAFYFYLFATLVGLSRVALGVHFPSDVLGGALVGLLVGFAFRSLLLNRFAFFRLKDIRPFR